MLTNVEMTTAIIWDLLSDAEKATLHMHALTDPDGDMSHLHCWPNVQMLSEAGSTKRHRLVTEAILALGKDWNIARAKCTS